MCLCKDHNGIQAEIADETRRGINFCSIPKVIRQAVDCHFFYNRSTLEECARSWRMSPDDVRRVSKDNLVSYRSFYDIRRDGDNIELIPNRKWFDWAENYAYQNHVYDEEAIKRERDRRAAIENALWASTLFRNRASTVADIAMCISAARALRTVEDVIREWHESGTHN